MKIFNIIEVTDVIVDDVTHYFRSFNPIKYGKASFIGKVWIEIKPKPFLRRNNTDINLLSEMTKRNSKFIL